MNRKQRRKLAKQIKKEKLSKKSVKDLAKDIKHRNKIKTSVHNFIKQSLEDYKKEFGVDPLDPSYDLFTEEQQIDRYSKNVIFWLKRKPHIEVDNISIVTTQIHKFVSDALNMLYKRMRDKNIHDKVFRRLEEMKEIHISKN